jgi:hypothetical protein
MINITAVEKVDVLNTSVRVAAVKYNTIHHHHHQQSLPTMMIIIITTTMHQERGMNKVVYKICEY